MPGAGTAGIELDVAPDPASEAIRIALRLRRALETPGKRAALVTTEPDPWSTGRRRSCCVGESIDDSAGVPLDQSAPGSFLLLTTLLATPNTSPVQLLAALKHPLAAGGIEAAEFRRRSPFAGTAGTTRHPPSGWIAGPRCGAADWRCAGGASHLAQNHRVGGKPVERPTRERAV